MLIEHPGLILIFIVAAVIVGLFRSEEAWNKKHPDDNARCAELDDLLRKKGM